MAQTVLILGGGVGGIVAAHVLRRSLPNEHRIILVDRQPSFVFAPSFLWVMTGGRTAEKISRPLARLKRKGIEVVHGEVNGIDPARREISVGSSKLIGDFLIIALGADLEPAAVPGLPTAGHNFYSLSGSESLRDALATFRSGRLVVLTAAPAYKCPAAPYEAAMLLEYHCRKRKIRDQVQIDVYAAEPGPMGVAGPAVSAGVRQMVEQKGIGYHPQHQVTQVDAENRRLAFANGASAEFDLLAYVPPHRLPRVVHDAGLVDESGWVPVDRHTLQSRFDRVYAIGDVAGIPLKLGKPLPKAGVFAHGEAQVVAQNIARAITGKGKPAAFDGCGECFIETGDGKAGFGRGDFFAEPVPNVKLHKVSWRWHVGKVLFEKHWLWRWF